MERKERMNALEVALKNEMKEREFYLAQAERTTNALGKAMFREIADDELDHYERLLQLHETWEKEQNWPDTAPLAVKRTKVQDILSAAGPDQEHMVPGNDDDLAALKKAIAFEARGIEYYKRLSAQVADPMERDFFNLLASIEEEHYRSLKETEELLLDPTAWFRVKERGGLDGAS